MSMSTRRKLSLQKAQSEFCKKLKLLQYIRGKLQDAAIEHVGTDIARALQTMEKDDTATSSIEKDLPEGFFRLSYQTFNERLKDEESSVYIEVCLMLPENNLQKHKMAVVIEDLCTFVRRLFLDYGTDGEANILMDISNSYKLLSIDRTLVADYKNNIQHLQDSKAKIKQLSIFRKAEMERVNFETLEIMNSRVENQIIKQPIEYRYQKLYYKGYMEQAMTEDLSTENKLDQTAKDLRSLADQEQYVSNAIQFKQSVSIQQLQAKINIMSLKYDTEFSKLQNEITYKQNRIDTLKSKHEEAIRKYKYILAHIEGLRQWKAKREKQKQKKKKGNVKKKKAAQKKKT